MQNRANQNAEHIKELKKGKVTEKLIQEKQEKPVENLEKKYIKMEV